MSRSIQGSVIVLLLVLSGCAGTASTSDSAPSTSRRDLLSRDQITAGSYLNAFDAVQSLRSQWLRPRGTDSFMAQGEVKVYVDDARAGGVAALRQISTQNIAYIQFYDGTEASGRWGLDHGHGVIFVSTRALTTSTR